MHAAPCNMRIPRCRMRRAGEVGAAAAPGRRARPGVGQSCTPLRPLSRSGWPSWHIGASPEKVRFGNLLHPAACRAHHASLSHLQPAATGGGATGGSHGPGSSSRAVPRPSPLRASFPARQCGQHATNGDSGRKCGIPPTTHCEVSTDSRCFRGRAGLGRAEMGAYDLTRPGSLPTRDVWRLARRQSPFAAGSRHLCRVCHAIPRAAR